jgi:hypothetical protein
MKLPPLLLRMQIYRKPRKIRLNNKLVLRKRMAGMTTMKKNLNNSWIRTTKRVRRSSLSRNKSHLPTIRVKNLLKTKALKRRTTRMKKTTMTT